MGIYKDTKTGNYGIRIKCYGIDRKKIIGPDKRKARVALVEVQQEIRLAKLAGQKWVGFEKLQRATKPITFTEAANAYMQERQNFKASSKAAYTYILSGALIPEFGNKPLTSITESSIRQFQAGLAEKVSPRRVNSILQLLRSILAQAYRTGEIARDPAIAVKRVEEEKTDVDPLSEEELTLALKNIDAHYRPLFTTLAYTGARPNEMQALRWTDIDWVKEEICITKGRVRGHEGKPKTKSSIRTIPMLPQVKEVLTELKSQLSKKSQTVASLTGYVFVDKKGQPIDKHLDRIWARALRDAQLRHRPSYQLRHTFASQCIIQGFPLPFIAKILGHSTIDTLVRHYAGWIDSATKEQEQKLRQAFQSIATGNQGTTSTVQLSKVEAKVEGALLDRERNIKLVSV
jgi:integrase